MKLAESSRLKLEEFFRQTLNDEHLRLPAIYFYAGKFSAALTLLLRIHGITIGKRIFITPKFVVRAGTKRKINLELAAHEIAHVLQFQREGFLSFFYKYSTSFLKNMRKQDDWDAASRQSAYLDIPFEIEARSVAAKFVEWNKRRQKPNQTTEG